MRRAEYLMQLLGTPIQLKTVGKLPIAGPSEPAKIRTFEL
jgi:hypothetical protein